MVLRCSSLGALLTRATLCYKILILALTWKLDPACKLSLNKLINELTYVRKESDGLRAVKKTKLQNVKIAMVPGCTQMKFRC